MTERSYAFKAGVFVLIAGIAAVAGALYFTRDEPQQRFVVLAHTTVAGLGPRAEVTYRGLPIGRVREIRIDDQDRRLMRIEIGVRANITLTAKTYARLQRSLVTGRGTLQLDDSGSNGEPLQTSEDDPATIPMRPPLLAELKRTAPKVIARLDRFTARLDQLVDDRLIRRVRKGTLAAAAFMGQLPKIGQNAKRALASVAPASRRLRKTLGDVDDFVDRLERLAKGLGRDLDKLSASGARIGSKLSDKTLPKTHRALGKLASAARAIERLVSTLRKNPQSLLRGRRRPPPGPGEPGYRRRREDR